MTTATSNILFNSFKRKLGLGIINLELDTFKFGLCNSGQLLSVDGQSLYSDLTDTILAGGGYPEGGVPLTGVSWASSIDKVVFNSDNVQIIATDGGVSAYYWFLYDATPPSKPLVGFGLLDNFNGGRQVTVTAGNPLKYTVPATGWFSLV